MDVLIRSGAHSRSLFPPILRSAYDAVGPSATVLAEVSGSEPARLSSSVHQRLGTLWGKKPGTDLMESPKMRSGLRSLRNLP